MKYCACDFDIFGDDLPLFSADWHRAHMVHHLAVFPDVDQGTRDNLASSVARAENQA